MSSESASGGKETGISTRFKGASLLNHKGEAISCITGLKDRTVLLYFAAAGSEPCKSFSKLLSEFYDIVRESGDDSIIVICVSNDRPREEHEAFFRDESMHPDWLMVEWAGDIQEIMDLYNVEKIPWLLVADKDAKAVVHDARDALSDIFMDSHGHMRPKEEAKAAIAAKWPEWRRLAGDWRASAGQALGGSSMSSACSSAAAAPNSQASSHSECEALRAARLAALDRRASGDFSTAFETSGSASSSSAPAPSQSAAAPSQSAAADSGAASSSSLGGRAAAGGSGSFASGSESMPGGGVAYTPEGGRIDLPPLIPPARSPDDDAASDMASEATGSVREDLDGDMAMEVEEAVASVVALGFPEDQAREALQVANGNPDRAVALLLGDA